MATRHYARQTMTQRASALRRYFRWLSRHGAVQSDPTASLSARAGGSRLPRVLSRGELNVILDEPPAPATAVTEAVRLRDDAVLELLYGSGLRVSELCGLSMDDVDGRGQWATVWGKGAKQRRVPISENAASAVQRWLKEGRPTMTRAGSPADALFLNSRGHRLGPRDVRRILDRRSPSPTHPTRSAPQFRHPHARRGRRPESCTGAARPRQRQDDPDLHSRQQGTPPGRVRRLSPEGLMGTVLMESVLPPVAFARLPFGEKVSTGQRLGRQQDEGGLLWQYNRMEMGPDGNRSGGFSHRRTVGRVQTDRLARAAGQADRPLLAAGQVRRRARLRRPAAHDRAGGPGELRDLRPDRRHREVRPPAGHQVRDVRHHPGQRGHHRRAAQHRLGAAVGPGQGESHREGLRQAGGREPADADRRRGGARARPLRGRAAGPVLPDLVRRHRGPGRGAGRGRSRGVDHPGRHPARPPRGPDGRRSRSRK